MKQRFKNTVQLTVESGAIREITALLKLERSILRKVGKSDMRAARFMRNTYYNSYCIQEIHSETEPFTIQEMIAN